MKGEKREGVPSEEGRIGENWRETASGAGEWGGWGGDGDESLQGGNGQFLEVLTENMGRG